MTFTVAIGRAGCQPPDPEEVLARRTRRWRLLILILVAGTVTGLGWIGYPVEAGLIAVMGVVGAAHVTARYLLDRPAPIRKVSWHVRRV